MGRPKDAPRPCQRLSAMALHTTHNLGSQGHPKRERCQSTRQKMAPIHSCSKPQPANASSGTTKLSRSDFCRSKSNTSPMDSSAAQREPVRAVIRCSSASPHPFMGGESAAADFETWRPESLGNMGTDGMFPAISKRSRSRHVGPHERPSRIRGLMNRYTKSVKKFTSA